MSSPSSEQRKITALPWPTVASVALVLGGLITLAVVGGVEYRDAVVAGLGGLVVAVAERIRK